MNITLKHLDFLIYTTKSVIKECESTKLTTQVILKHLEELQNEDFEPRAHIPTEDEERAQEDELAKQDAALGRLPS